MQRQGRLSLRSVSAELARRGHLGIGNLIWINVGRAARSFGHSWNKKCRWRRI
jgi:hypothetical protein